MGRVGRGKVVRVDLLAEVLDRRVDEKRRAGGAGTAPDDIWRVAMVPFSDFRDNSDGLGRVNEVGTDEVKPLSLRINGPSLAQLNLWLKARLRRPASYSDRGDSFFQFLHIAGYYYYTGTLLCQQSPDTSAHPLGATGEKNGLSKYTLAVHTRRRKPNIHDP